MSSRASLFVGSRGLSSRVDPVRLRTNGDTGLTPLVECSNVTIDDSGRVNRRQGYTLARASVGAQSIFCDGGHALFVAGDTLYRLEFDLTPAVLRTGLTAGARMRYVQVGDDIFFCNGHENGRYSQADGLAHAWTGQTRIGPWTDRYISDVPVGHLLSYYRGRVFLADGPVLWFTEPHAYSWTVQSENYIMFEGRVRMVCPVDDGIYVSDDKRTYFLQGDDPQKFLFRDVADYPAVEGTDILLPDGRRALREQPMGGVGMWTSRKGICRGESGGVFVNLTEDDIELPVAATGCAGMFMDQYIVILDS